MAGKRDRQQILSLPQTSDLHVLDSTAHREFSVQNTTKLLDYIVRSRDTWWTLLTKRRGNHGRKPTRPQNWFPHPRFSQFCRQTHSTRACCLDWDTPAKKCKSNTCKNWTHAHNLAKRTTFKHLSPRKRHPCEPEIQVPSSSLLTFRRKQTTATTTQNKLCVSLVLWLTQAAKLKPTLNWTHLQAKITDLAICTCGHKVRSIWRVADCVYEF